MRSVTVPLFVPFNLRNLLRNKSEQPIVDCLQTIRRSVQFWEQASSPCREQSDIRLQRRALAAKTTLNKLEKEIIVQTMLIIVISFH